MIYDICPHCGAAVLVAWTSHVQELIHVDPLPVKKGSVIYDSQKNLAKIVLAKYEKFHKKEQRWQPHVASCSHYKEV